MSFKISIDTGTETQLEKMGSQLIDAGEDIISGTVTHLTVLGRNIVDSFNPEYYLEVANTVAGDAMDYANKLVEQLLSSITTMTTVSIGSLMGEVAPFAKNATEAGKLLGERLDSLVDDIEKTAKNELENIEYYLGDVADNLAPIKAYATAQETVTFAIDSAQSVVKIIEPLIPLFKQASDTSLIIASGGATASEVVVDAAKINEWKVQYVLNLLLEKFKNILYSIKVPVPQIVAGFLKRVSIKQAVMDFGNQWLNSIFSSQFYSETIANTFWMQTINEEIYHLEKDILNSQNYKFDTWLGIRDYIDTNRYSDNLLNNFLANLTRITLDTIIDNARATIDLVTFGKNLDGTKVAVYEGVDESTNISSSKTATSLIVLDTQKKLLGTATNGISEDSIRLLSGQILGCI